MSGFRTILPLTGFASGDRMILASTEPKGMPWLKLDGRAGFPCLRAGDELADDVESIFRVLGRLWWPTDAEGPAKPCYLVESLKNVADGGGEITLEPSGDGCSLAWVTLSDKGAAGMRDDESGPLIESLVRESLDLRFTQGFILPDDRAQLTALLNHLALEDGYDLILTTGGTGVGPRDITPEATLAVLEKRLPGFERAMTMSSLEKTPHGAISRGVAGTVGRSLILNLPGSPKAVRENLLAVLPAIGHTLDKLHGDPTDCALS